MKKIRQLLLILTAIMLCTLCVGTSLGLYTSNATKNVSITTRYVPSVYLTGSFNNWATNNNDYKFAYNGTNYTLNGISIPAQSTYKICDSDNNWYPANNIDIAYGGIYNFTSNGTSVTHENVSYFEDVYYLQIKRGGVILSDSPTLTLNGTQYEVSGVSLNANDQVRVYNPKLGYRSNFKHSKGIDAVGSIQDSWLTIGHNDTYGFYLTNPTTTQEIWVASNSSKYVITASAGWDLTSSGATFFVYAFNDSTNAWYECTYTGTSTLTVSVVLPNTYTTIIVVRCKDGTTIGTASWDVKWNQTNNITLPTSSNTASGTFS